MFFEEIFQITEKLSHLCKPKIKVAGSSRKRKREIKPKFYLSENGSLLPNKWARWDTFGVKDE